MGSEMCIRDSDHHVELPTLFNAQLQNLKRVLDQMMLDFKVNACVSAKARHVVHLKHPVLQLVVQHDIEAKQVAACVRLLGLAGTVQVLQLRLDDHKRLDNNLLDLVPNLVSLLPVGATIGTRRDELSLQYVTQTELMLRTIEVFAITIERVVGEMDVGVVVTG